MPEWDADIVVDETLVRALIAEQFPELDVDSARPLGEGWDNSVWVVEERWAFRFPRRAIAIPGVRRELEALPMLASLLPVPIPAPQLVGAPNERYPWPFFGAPLLLGDEPAEAELTDDDRVRIGEELGLFLRTLHSPETLAAVDPQRVLPVDFNRRADMPYRVAGARRKLDGLRTDIWRPPALVERILTEAEGLPPVVRGSDVLTHGDLHIRHVLLERGAITGVIDWGDICLADPAIDLMLVWMLLRPAARERFFAAYGRIGDEQLLRARVLALFLGVTLAAYARDVDNARLERECVAALERTLID
jgi:aminoglycoside phosphotransferase (APT) family kinase protein